jgi:PKD repeat protein
LIATNGAGSDTEIKIDYIEVGLLVDFSADPVTGQTPPLFVRFSDLTTGNPTTWAWNFGDGETSSLKNPVHLYNSAGVYTVSLTASNLSASGTRTRINYITAIFYRVSTKDMSPPVDRIDLRTMYGEGDSTYRYPKKGVQISTAQDTETDSGFTRPNGPTLIFD